MSDKIHSTGRGGAGNIGVDPTTYVDGDIIREGAPYEGGEYRGGRGGAGNTAIGTKVNADKQPVGVSGTVHTSEDVIPEPAMRTNEGHDNFHTGRGGAGNQHRAEFGGHSSAAEAAAADKHHTHAHDSLLDKAKHAIGLDKKKEPTA